MRNRGLGEFEELVLLAVCILDDNAYGVSVKRKWKNIQEGLICLGPFI